MSGKGRGSRRRDRTLAFQALYGLSFSPAGNLEDVRRAFAVSSRNLEPEEQGIGAEPEGFAWRLTAGAWELEKELDEAISGYSHNWKTERMGRIELVLLRLALYEMLHCGTPPRVVINEALELADEFGAEKSKHFINGILDAASRSRQVKMEPDE